MKNNLENSLNNSKHLTTIFKPNELITLREIKKMKVYLILQNIALQIVKRSKNAEFLPSRKLSSYQRLNEKEKNVK